jgi:hypothetical protein
MAEDTSKKNDANASETEAAVAGAATQPVETKEVGGRKGPDPTRFGDWEKDGRCIDF